MKSAGTKHGRRDQAWVLASALVSLLASSLWAAQAKPLSVLEGKLLTTRGNCPLLKTNGRELALSANTPYLLHTMQDKRLDERKVRLEETVKPDGAFEVQWLYTLHHSKLFKVRYFALPAWITSGWATMQELRDFALPYGVTQGLSWLVAIFQVGDFSRRTLSAGLSCSSSVDL